MSTDPTPAQVDEALENWSGDPESRGADYVSASVLAAEVRRLRAETESLRAIFPRILAALKSGACSPDCSLEFLAWIPDEVGGVTDHLRADLLSWQGNCQRMADQHGDLSKELGEAVSRAEQAEAKIAALVSAGDAMRVHLEPRRVGFSTNARDSVTAWDAAKSGAQLPDLADPREDKARLDWIEARGHVEIEIAAGIVCITRGERVSAAGMQMKSPATGTVSPDFSFTYPYRFTGDLRAAIDAARAREGQP